jgi:glucan biosynthesis protein C
LLYALIYAILRFTLNKTSFANKFKLNVIVFSVAFCIIVVIASVLVRDHFKIGDFRSIYGFFMIEVAHWPNYLGFLTAGIITRQTDMVQKFPSTYGKVLLVVGIILALKVYFPPLFPDALNSLAGEYFEIYETILSFSLSFGLITLFRDYLNMTGNLFANMARDSYGAYIFHYPIVIAIQYGFDKINMSVFSKFMIVGLLSIVATFAFAHIIRKIKIIQKII